jgi:hypothetical protein
MDSLSTFQADINDRSISERRLLYADLGLAFGFGKWGSYMQAIIGSLRLVFTACHKMIYRYSIYASKVLVYFVRDAIFFEFLRLSVYGRS